MTLVRPWFLANKETVVGLPPGHGGDIPGKGKGVGNGGGWTGRGGGGGWGKGGKGGGGGATPNYFDDVMLQIAFQEANGSTTGADDSRNSFDWTAAGDANVQSSKLALDGAGDYATLASDAHDWSFIHGGAPFTMEWPTIRRAGISHRNTILDTCGNTSTQRGIVVLQGDGGVQPAGTIRVYIVKALTGDVVIDYTTTFTIPDDGADHHLVIEYDVGDGTDLTNRLRFGLDGVRQEMADLPDSLSISIADSTYDMLLGRTNGSPSIDYEGNYPPIRITRDRLRYDLLNNATYTYEADAANWPTSEVATGLIHFPPRYSSKVETVGYVGSDYYRHEPRYIDLGSGTILKVQMRGAQHEGTTSTLVESFKSTNYGRDFLYSTRVVVDSDGTNAVRNHAVGRDASSGRLICFARTADGSNVTQDVFFKTSTDDGATWSGRTSVASSLTSGTIPFGKIIETTNGLMAVIYDEDFAEALFSTDGGQSWGGRTTIYDETGTTPGYNEPSVVALDTSNLVAMARKDDANNNDYVFYQSSDGGSSWSLTGEANWTASNLIFACPGAMAVVGSNVVTVWGERGDGWGIYYSVTDKSAYQTDPRRAVDGTETQVKTRRMRYDAGWSNTGAQEYGYPDLIALSGDVLIGWYEAVFDSSTVTRTWERTVDL